MGVVGQVAVTQLLNFTIYVSINTWAAKYTKNGPNGIIIKYKIQSSSYTIFRQNGKSWTIITVKTCLSFKSELT
jgi:hypothetical protein